MAVGPRAKITQDGIYIAKQGKTVNDGLNFQQFSPDIPSQTYYMTGIVPIASFVNWDGDSHSFFGGFYRRASLNFGKTFARPPIVYYAGRGETLGNWSPNITQWRWNPSNLNQRGVFPELFISVSTTKVDFWLNRERFNGGVRYYVMENMT